MYRPATYNKENVPVKSTQVVKPLLSFNSDLLNDTILGPNEPIVPSKRQPPASLLGMTANSMDLSAIMKKVNA